MDIILMLSIIISIVLFIIGMDMTIEEDKSIKNLGTRLVSTAFAIICLTIFWFHM